MMQHPGKRWSAALIVALGVLGMWSREVAAAPGWSDGLQAGIARAKESGKPLFVVFRCVR